MRNEWLSLLGGFLSSGKSSNKGAIEKRRVQVGSDSYDYQVYIPANLQIENGLPVIIFLHGIRERGSGGFVPMEGIAGNLIHHYFAQVPAIVLLPHCRPGCYWSDPVMDEMVMLELAQSVKEFAADEKRIYLIGVSMGGYGVWHFASAYPEKFAALVSICGGSSITKGDRFIPLAEKVKKTPAWLFHGADDKVVQVSESRQIVEALKANQGNVKYNEYSNVGHNVWMNVLSEKELMPWLLAQHLE
jgi:predicted peptidase